MLVLLLGRIYVLHCDGLKWHDTHDTFHTDRLRRLPLGVGGGAFTYRHRTHTGSKLIS
jgi:hypothetical protein